MKKRGNWLRLAALMLAGAGLLSCLLHVPACRMSPSLSIGQVSLSDPASRPLGRETGWRSGSRRRAERWLVGFVDQTGETCCWRPLPRRGLPLRHSPEEGCRVVLTRLPAFNCTL
ncbi:MAG: hypothetical protein ACI3VN_06440 [Candidatus Onthomonas sp.]